MNKQNLCSVENTLRMLPSIFLIFTSLYSVDICAHEMIAVFVVSSQSRAGIKN